MVTLTNRIINTENMIITIIGQTCIATSWHNWYDFFPIYVLHAMLKCENRRWGNDVQTQLIIWKTNFTCFSVQFVFRYSFKWKHTTVRLHIVRAQLHRIYGCLMFTNCWPLHDPHTQEQILAKAQCRIRDSQILAVIAFLNFENPNYSGNIHICTCYSARLIKHPCFFCYFYTNSTPVHHT